MKLRRVVVTGLGAITPIGKTVPEMWEGIKEGRCGKGTGLGQARISYSSY